MIEKSAIAVAVDGSAASMAAVRWAATEAGCRRVSLKIVHVCEVNSAYLWAMPRLPEQLREFSRPTVRKAIELARETAPGIEASEWTMAGPVSRMLLLASESVSTLVLGRTGASSLAAQLVGSTVHRMAAHAHCPVVIVPEPSDDRNAAREPGRIVVGMADRPTQGHAIDFAIHEAGRHSIELLAVRAWHGPDGPGTDPAQQEAEQQEQVRQLLASHLAGAQRVSSTALVRAGTPASVLCGSCRPADLLVLGQHRHAPFTPATLGRVIADCIHQAPCPVAVVPEPAAVPQQDRPRVPEVAGLIAY